MADLRRNPLYVMSHAVMLVAVGIGTYARLVGLGEWPLTRDEYYLGQSIHNLLEHGVPLFKCGGYYVRGLLQQYLTAPLLLFSFDPEWALRILPVVSNLFGIPAVYLLGKRLGGYRIACAAVVIFSLSIWEIEFARFARMYAPFQTLFLWQLVFLFKVVLDNKSSALIWMYALSGLSILVYEGAIFVVAINILPFLLGKQRVTVAQGVVNALLIVAAVLFQTTDFRHLGVVGYLPAEITGNITAHVEGSKSLPIIMPAVLITTLSHAPVWALLGLLPLTLIVLTVLDLWRAAEPPRMTKLSWILVLSCAALNLFALALVMALLAYLLGMIRVDATPPRHWRRVGIAVLGCFVYWAAYGLLTDHWVQQLAKPGTADVSQYHHLLVVLLKYPEVYYSVFWPWFTAMPVLTVAVVAILGIGLGLVFLCRTSGQVNAFPLLFAIALGEVIFMSMLEVPHNNRYSFFLYPVFILLVCTTLNEVARLAAKKETMQIALCYALVGAFFFFPEDFNVYHIKNIDSAAVNFRTIYSEQQKGLYYPRHDYASPAHYINEHADPADRVFSLVPVVDYYLKKTPDFMYIDLQDHEFKARSGCGGDRDLWSNARLVYRWSDVLRLVKDSKAPMWLIINTDRSYWQYGYGIKGPYQGNLRERYAPFLAYTNVDKSIQVYRIPPQSK